MRKVHLIALLGLFGLVAFDARAATMADVDRLAEKANASFRSPSTDKAKSLN